MALSKIKSASLVEGAVVDRGFRNLLINGAMTVSQRGTSSTGVTYGDYWNAPDRWRIDLNALGTYTMSQSTTAPDGFSNSYKVACTTADASPAAGDYFKFQQCIEGQNVQHLQHGSSSAKKLTVSFWVRSSKTGTYTLELEHVDATYFNPKTYSISTADTWEHKTLTFDGYQTTAIANDATTGLRLNWWLGAGSTYDGGTFTDGTWHNTTANRVSGSNVNIGDSTSNDWYITGVQAEIGDTATDFEHRLYGDELRRCLRYYEITPVFAYAYHYNVSTHGNDKTGATFTYKVQKRADPTKSTASGSITSYSSICDEDGGGCWRTASFSSGLAARVEADAELS